MNPLLWRYVLIILLAVTLPIGFVTLLLTMRAWRSQQRVNAARSWQSAPGTVIAARVEQVNIPVRVQTSISTYRLATRYAPVVAYAYFVNGTYLHGERLRLGPRVLSSEAADAEREITRYPVGTRSRSGMTRRIRRMLCWNGGAGLSGSSG